MEKKDEIKKNAITNEMLDKKVVLQELDENDLEQVSGGDITFCPKKKGS